MSTIDLQHRFHLTPGHCLLALLAVEFLLFLLQWFRWLPKGWPVLIAVASVGVVVLGMFVWFGVAVVLGRRFQFSIRSLLALVLVVAVPCSWMAVDLKKAREQNTVASAIVGAGGAVFYDYQISGQNMINIAGRMPLVPRWLQNSLGTDLFADVVGAAVDNDDSIARLIELRHLRLLFLGLKDPYMTTGGMGLSFGDDKITDTGLRYLEGLGHLEGVHLTGSKLTNSGLEHLRGVPHLKILCIWCPSVTDDGLRCIGSLSTVEDLQIDSPEVTDEGLRHLYGMPRLTKLEIYNSQVTDAGVAKLQQALPNCKITH
jgi:hypothetical protein